MYKVINLHLKTNKQYINNLVEDQKNSHLDLIQQK